MNLYWILLVLMTLIVIILNFFKVAEGHFNPKEIVRRVAISIILLWSFDEVINIISMITDGVSDKLGGVEALKNLYGEIKKRYVEDTPSLLNFRQMFLYTVNVICYLVAILGYYVTDVLIHLSYTVLYVLSPLMILAYVSESTAYITSNLYKGLLHISLWKILWCLLGVLLLKLATVPEASGWDSILMQAILNFCIGFSMLTIPFFAKGLLGNGLQRSTSSLASSLTAPVSTPIKVIPSVVAQILKQRGSEGFRASGRFMANRAGTLRKRLQEMRRKRKFKTLRKKTQPQRQNQQRKRQQQKEIKKYEQSKTFDQWQKINDHLFWYRFLAVLSFVLSSILCFLLLINLTADPIVVFKEESSKKYYRGVREDVEITEDDVTSFIAGFIKTRYSWAIFDPPGILEKLSCYTTEGFLAKLKETLGKEKYDSKKGQTIEQYVAYIRPRLEEEKAYASFDRILRINGIPLVTPTQIALELVQESMNPCNPMGLYVNSLTEYDGP